MMDDVLFDYGVIAGIEGASPLWYIIEIVRKPCSSKLRPPNKGIGTAMDLGWRGLGRGGVPSGRKLINIDV